MTRISESIDESGKSASWTKRNGFPDWLIATTWLVVAFILFQLVANILAVVFILAQNNFVFEPSNLMNLVTENLRWVFVGNSIGQVGILGGLTWIVSKLVIGGQRKREFFYLSKSNSVVKATLFSFAIMITLQPIIWYLGYLNQLIPLPASYLEFENQQMKILTDFLTTEKSLTFILFHVAIVPAFCEEILFRGFIFRLYTKSAGWIWGIFISGILFGLYHFKLTQAIPLSLIGMLFAWITYKSGSLIPAIVAHLVNNGGSVVVAFIYPDFAMASPEQMLPDWWVILLSLAISAFLLFGMNRLSDHNQSQNS